MTKTEGDDVNVEQKYDKGKIRTESGNFILYHIDAKQHSLSKNPLTNKEDKPTNQKENLQAAIESLELTIEFVDSEEDRKQLQEAIEALKITLEFL
jgi:pyruvate/2-oxoacid:ferredoxin oxidoreductase beta subunit